MADEKVKIISVKATGKTGEKKRKEYGEGQVVLWEVNAAHPDGECFISHDGKVREVAETPEVLRAIGEGRLEVVSKETEPFSAFGVRRGRPPKNGGEVAPVIEENN